MQTNKHKINNYERALRKIAVERLYINPAFFSQFSLAYIATNENIRYEIGLTETNKKSILTIAGSGDQPIFYSLNGAKDIDTFDISFCSKVIMDIKSIALKTLTRDQYIQLLKKLYKSKDIQSVIYMDKIVTEIPNDTKYFLEKTNKSTIFKHPSFDIEDSSTGSMLTVEEFEKAKKTINSPFNFIWTDIKNLHKKLEKQYDIINLSNLFDYKKPETIYNTIQNLKDYIKIGGHIIVSTEVESFKLKPDHFIQPFNKLKKETDDINIIKKEEKTSKTIVFMIQRTK